MENPIKIGWFGGPTPNFGNTHIDLVLEFCMSRPVLNSVVNSTMFHTQSYSVYLNLVIGTRSRFSQASSHTWWFSRLTVFPMQPHLGIGPQKHQLLYQSLAERQLDGNFGWWRWRSFLARDMVSEVVPSPTFPIGTAHLFSFFTSSKVHKLNLSKLIHSVFRNGKARVGCSGFQVRSRPGPSGILGGHATPHFKVTLEWRRKRLEPRWQRQHQVSHEGVQAPPWEQRHGPVSLLQRYAYLSTGHDRWQENAIGRSLELFFSCKGTHKSIGRVITSGIHVM